MDNMRKRITIRIVKTQKDFIKYASRPTYTNHDIFGKRLVAIYQKKKKKELLTLNKPLYIGCTVLYLSKLEMYNGKMKNEYGGTPIYEFIGLGSKMYSICDINKK